MRILLVDDHQILCVALSEHLERVASRVSSAPIQVTPVFRLRDAIDAINGEERPDLVFLDLDLDHEHRGPATLKRFQDENPHRIPVVIFTGLALDDQGAVEALRQCLKDLGARGILLKRTDLESTFIGLARILAGELWMPQEVFMALATTPMRANSANYHLGLSPREWDVARCLTRGLQDKQIANELRLSPHYVRQVTKQIYDKLDVKTRTQAAMRVSKILDDDGARTL
jgi:two-component system nitrate/nitrite response regulator NarL